MILALSLAAALALGGAPDPCGAVEPAAASDPSLAPLYRAVGDAERAAGAMDSAAAAYRSALSHDPHDAAARAGLAAACAAPDDAAFREGLRLMRGGDLRGAIAAFERARSRSGDPAAALLEGICLYESGDDAAAAPLLRAAEADPAQRENARFFLGLVALRAGRSAEAQDLLTRAASDQELAPFARELVRSARRSGRLALSFVTESGWDSNVDLTPDVLGGTAHAGDGVGSTTALAELRPLGESGPFLRAAGSWREQATLHAFDMWGGGGSAGWQGGRGGHFWLAEYGYDFRELARAPYLSAHRLFATARLQIRGDASVGASWLTRFETFEPAVDAGYSGVRHVAEADLTQGLGRRTALVAAWRAGRDVTRDRALSWWEQGPRLALRVAPAQWARVGLDAALAWRRYDEVDPALPTATSPGGVRRGDFVLDVGALVELDVADRWTVRASTSLRREVSNVPDFTYTKFVPMIGVGYAVGLF